MRIIHIRWTIFLALFIAGISFCSGAGALQAQSAQTGMIDPAEQKSQTASANPSQGKPDYSQEPYIFERFITQVAFQKDGTSRADLLVVVDVLSEAGVQRFGQLVFPYNSSNQKLEVISIEIRKAGSSSFTSASAVRDLAPLASGGAPAFSDYREKRVTVPGLRPGDTVAYHIVRTTTNLLAPEQFWFEHDFVKEAIVLEEQLEISVPRNGAIKLKTETGTDPIISDEAERRVYRWKRSRAAREGRVAQKNKWSPESQIPDVQITTFKNWEDVALVYARLVSERAIPDAAVRAKAEELTRNKTRETEKIEALYDFVATKVRTVSFPFSLSDYSPHAASETLKNEYGDPKDKHTLLQGLLDAAGIRAFPALISSSRNLDPEFASPGEINHVITAIPQGTGDKDWLWLDTSSEVAPFRMLAAPLRGKRALIVPIAGSGASSKPGTPALVTTPADPPAIQVQNIDVTGQVDDHGKLTAHIHYSMTGDTALTLRMAFRRTPESSWKQLAQLLAAGDGFSGEISSVKAGDPSDTHKPFEVDYAISQASFADWSRKHLQMRLPLPALGIPESAEAPEGHVKPLKLGSPLEIHVHATIELPAAYAPRAPVPVSMSRDFATYQSKYSVKGTIVEARRDLVFRQREIPEDLAADYSAFARAARADEAQVVPVDLSPLPAPPGTADRDSPK